MKTCTFRFLFPALAVALLAAGQSLAAFVLVDDFESYSTGNANGGGSTAFTGNGGPWQPRDSGGDIGGSGLIRVENDGSTNHFAFGWNAGTRSAYLPSTTPIADGDSATYYFQVRTTDDTPDMSYGLSDEPTATGAGFGDFEAQVALVDDGDNGNGEFKLIARDGADGFVDLATGLVADTWYDIWLVVNNATDTYTVYMDANGGDPDALGSLVGQGLGFRNGPASNDLVTFMVLEPNGNPTDATAHLDNIYYSRTTVPEPSTIALAVGAVALLAYRRVR